jgi:hypothetical protein
MKRKAAAIAAGLMSIGSVAGASVLVQNFMSAEFSAGAPPCLIKVAGADVAFDGFAFDVTGTSNVDGVDLLTENITIAGLTGDRVVATDVYRIQNNCAVPLEVNIVDGAATGDWTQKHLEVWLGGAEAAIAAAPATVGYPGAGADISWDSDALVFDPGPVVTNDTTIGAHSTEIVINPGMYVPVGMIVSTGNAAVGTANATWTVSAEMP